MFILMPLPHSLDYYSFVVSFQVGKCETSNFVLLFQDFAIFLKKAILGLLHFHMNFKISFQFLPKKKKCQQGFDRGGTESVDQFGEYCHLNNESSSS